MIGMIAAVSPEGVIGQGNKIPWRHPGDVRRFKRVTLESTIIAHGLPWPQNLEVARALERAVRDRGAVPATIAVVAGRVVVGLSDDELQRMASGQPERFAKAGVADLGATYPQPEEARRAYQQNPEAMRAIESAVLEDQVVDWALATARVTERPMSFKELTGFGPGAQSEQPLALSSEVSST